MGKFKIRDVIHLLCSPARLACNGEERGFTATADYLESDPDDRYPVVEGIPDLRPNARNSVVRANSYTSIHANFSSRSVTKDEVERQTALLDLTPEHVAQKTVLLAGTGMGLQLPLLLSLGPALVIAVDYSDHIRAVAANFSDSPVFFVQADVMNLPFRRGVFDFCFNAGVMQHVRSPELAFRQLHRVTRSGGALSIGALYDSSLKHRLVNAQRLSKQFHKLPYAEARAKLEKIVRARRAFERVGLYRLHYWLTGSFVVPFSAKHSFDFQMDQTMDWYYPEYRHLIDDDEVRNWFKDVGILNVTRGRRQFVGIKQ